MTNASNMLTHDLNNGCYRLDYDWLDSKKCYLNSKEIIGVILCGLDIQIVTTCAVFNARMCPAWANADEDNMTWGDLWWYISEITR